MAACPSHRVRVSRWTAMLAVLLASSLTACAGPPEVRLHGPGDYPERLSAWGVVTLNGDQLRLGRGVVPYEVATPLFSDYALKLRTIYLPDGTAMRYRAAQSFDFPTGSIISKTFFYPHDDGHALAVSGWSGDVTALNTDDYRLVETRLLVKEDNGWSALPYVWEGDDAYLRITGAVVPIRLALADARGTAEIPYVVPARSECAGCHATDHDEGSLELIGVKARHLNQPYPGQERSQLQAWEQQGRLTEVPEAASRPVSVAWDDPRASVEQRARAYLDSNCGHCHSPDGPAATSGLMLDAHTSAYRPLGFCKPPIAAGRGTGGRPYSIVPGQPDRSILIHRMETSDPATRMPETGRSLAHLEAVELLRRWVRELPGECV